MESDINGSGRLLLLERITRHCQEALIDSRVFDRRVNAPELSTPFVPIPQRLSQPARAEGSSFIRPRTSRARARAQR
jgi:hypothetical protein